MDILNINNCYLFSEEILWQMSSSELRGLYCFHNLEYLFFLDGKIYWGYSVSRWLYSKCLKKINWLEKKKIMAMNEVL